MSGRLDLSVIVPTNEPWPSAAESVESLLAQLDPATTEVLVASRRADAVPAGAVPPLRLVQVDSDDAFTLRAAALAEARGELVAVGEDHVRYDEGWSAALFAGFAANPTMAGVMGSITNSETSPLDRASFWVTLAPWSAPMAVLPTDRTPVPGNIVVRREHLADAGRPGAFEYEIVPALLAAGLLVANDAQRLRHDQSLGWRTWGVHVASGRAYGAQASRGSRRVRAREAFRAPMVILRQTRRAWEAPGRRPDSLACQGLVLAIGVANATGQLLGVALGAGRAGSRIV